MLQECFNLSQLLSPDEGLVYYGEGLLQARLGQVRLRRPLFTHLGSLHRSGQVRLGRPQFGHMREFAQVRLGQVRFSSSTGPGVKACDHPLVGFLVTRHSMTTRHSSPRQSVARHSVSQSLGCICTGDLGTQSHHRNRCRWRRCKNQGPLTMQK